MPSPFEHSLKLIPSFLVGVVQFEAQLLSLPSEEAISHSLQSSVPFSEVIAYERPVVRDTVGACLVAQSQVRVIESSWS